MAQPPKRTKSWTPNSKSQVTGLAVLRQPSLYIHIVWALSLGIPLGVGEGLFVGSKGWAAIPLLLNLALVVASGLNVPFPSINPRIPRLLVGTLLFAVSFFQKVNTTEADQRPYWANLTLWISLILLALSIQSREFTLAIVSMVSSLLSFLALLV